MTERRSRAVTVLIVVAGLFSGVEVAMPYIEPTLPRGIAAALSIIATAGAFVARMIAQREVSRDR